MSPSPAFATGTAHRCFWTAWEASPPGGLGQLRVAEVFRGRPGETLLLPGVMSIAAGGALLVGVGVRGSLASVRRAAHVAAMQAQRLGCRQVASDCDGALWHADRDASALMAAALVGIAGILEAEPGGTKRWTFVSRTERIEHFSSASGSPSGGREL
ncbi:M17 family peptidase N-terminal domain-containing protein [Sphingomonas morindae]|uniref:Peptidase M17 leucyl aminopeptidase N-terminal domain-containing protein n=1 Tax=Sphingomonas morindae TaxID=1541170 RepID=A0ABY4X7E6_9SPHN|nr:M17 family peptidase N-terminal domain-containing protein [Sphingomonas morindae]USI72835.1 hypothetical protein LHA26_16450 [Sphingomonas morindae]